jgi:molybdopterin-guanine dinucleotide biosynthesis protein B
MKRPYIIGFYGYSNCGKTTLIERVIKVLTEQGLHIAVIKQSGHPVSMDTSGKDTARFTLAGADPVVLSSECEIAIKTRTLLKIDEIIDLFSKIKILDLVLIESARDVEIKKIRIGLIELRENTIWTYDGDFDKLITIIKNGGLVCIK